MFSASRSLCHDNFFVTLCMIRCNVIHCQSRARRIKRALIVASEETFRDLRCANHERALSEIADRLLEWLLELQKLPLRGWLAAVTSDRAFSLRRTTNYNGTKESLRNRGKKKKKIVQLDEFLISNNIEVYIKRIVKYLIKL